MFYYLWYWNIELDCLFISISGVFLPGLCDPEDCKKSGVLNKPLCLAWSSAGRNHYIALVGVKGHICVLSLSCFHHYHKTNIIIFTSVHNVHLFRLPPPWTCTVLVWLKTTTNIIGHLILDTLDTNSHFEGLPLL